MKKKMTIATALLLSWLFVLPMQVSALNLMESFFLKITIVENGIEHEWEYTSPGKYEYEKGEQVIKTDEAKVEMQSIVKLLNLSEKAKVEEMVDVLQKERYPTLERLEIRWMNGESKLYTWVWDKTN
ncbi:hypothetical protein BKP35_12695 [Anaerobacillus arseniciselenatis]|uniref:Uncharacterized protein n=1 Tax=Anaerobacillus arseniciselenatis TaxID=85682 RepID=A0A1S2LFC7_9BACI|nr:hypothetical protein [Anaerobacillus arseniciselenatis]OIJ10940.1 hypothetical protein BKP35_12695 [Anaerobacillus arseniciselenatis]